MKQLFSSRYIPFYTLLVFIVLLLTIYFHQPRLMLITVLCLLGLITTYIRNKKKIYRSISNDLKFNISYHFDKITELEVLSELMQELNLVDKNIQQENGMINFKYPILQKINSDVLKLKNELQNLQQHLENQKWLQEGESKISEVLRNNLEVESSVAFSMFLATCVNYCKASQGIMFQITTQHSFHNFQAVATYAISMKQVNAIHWEEGLAGEAIQQTQVQIIENIPPQYLVESGLGEHTAVTLVLIPIHYNAQPVALIELSFIRKLSSQEKIFLNKIPELSGVVIANRLNNEKTKDLLTKSLKSELELKENTDKLKENEHALKVAKEELDNKLIELKAESNLTTCIVNAINKSNASMELDLYGNILHANQMFLNVMGYTLNDIQGKHESCLMDKDEAAGEKYQIIWESLKSGDFISGEFIRKNSAGNTVWLEATYNPIKDLEGKPYKIIMFATFTTEMKEKENDYVNKISLLNESSAYIELNTVGEIKNSNQKFLDIMKLKRKDIKGIPFHQLINKEENRINGAKVFQQQFPIENTIRGHLCLYDSAQTPHNFNAILMPTKDITNKTKGYLVLLNPKE